MDTIAINFDEIVQKEYEFKDTEKFNKSISRKDFIILHVNIRSLNEDFEKLEVFLKSLNNKPSVIICSETWIIKHVELFKLSEYKIFYNDSKINKADGVVVYIRNDISQDTKISEIDKAKFLVTDLNINDDDLFRISAIYRSHDISKTEFVLLMKKFLLENRNIKNHCIVGDFNIDIRHQVSQNYEYTINQEYLNNFLEHEYIPCFQGVTRPSSNAQGGTFIDNFFLKTNTIEAKSYKIVNPFNDHFSLLVKFNNVRPPYKDKKDLKKLIMKN